MTTVTIKNKLYRIVSDKDRADTRYSGCRQCAFNDEGECTDDPQDNDLDCLTGCHHYLSIEDKEVA